MSEPLTGRNAFLIRQGFLTVYPAPQNGEGPLLGRNAFLIRQGFLTLNGNKQAYKILDLFSRNAFLIRQGFLTVLTRTGALVEAPVKVVMPS